MKSAFCGPTKRTRGRTGPDGRPHCPAPAAFFFGGAGQTICYHVHRGSYCDIGGIHELPSKQMDCVGRSGSHPPDCSRRRVRLARRRDATSTVKHYSVLPGRLQASVSAISLPSGKLAFLSAHNDGAQRRHSRVNLSPHQIATASASTRSAFRPPRRSWVRATGLVSNACKPISKIRPSDGCGRDAVPLVVERWYDFHGFGCHLGNVGSDTCPKAGEPSL